MCRTSGLATAAATGAVRLVAGAGAGGPGDPTCFDAEGDGTSFLRCCSTRLFGAEGNAACWDAAGGYTFERCCTSVFSSKSVDRSGEQEILEARELVQMAKADVSSGIVSYAQLLHRVDIERHAFGERSLSDVEAWLLHALNEVLAKWRAAHLKELASRLPEALARLSRLAHKPPHGNSGGPPRVAVLTACTPETTSSDICKLSANLWQCYAHQHGYHFILDTNPYPSVPRRFRFGTGGIGVSSEHMQHAFFDALDLSFEPENFSFLEGEPELEALGTDGLDFKWWQRWYAARRALPFFDLLLVVDPDTAVFPACVGVGLPEAFGFDKTDVEGWPGVATRDPRPGEDTNGGVFALTGGPWGFLFLELLLARSRWPIDLAGGSGWCHARQTAEFETFLEVAALADYQSQLIEGMANPKLSYDSECMTKVLPQVIQINEDQGPIAGCVWPNYRQCWDKAIRNLAGEPGRRSGPAMSRAALVNPGISDVNYRPWSNEARYRAENLHGTLLPALERTAFLWHYVGIPDKVLSLLRDFRIGGLADTLDCQSLHTNYKLEWGVTCALAGSPEPCPYNDSNLMPLRWGC